MPFIKEMRACSIHQVDDGVIQNLNLEEGGDYTGISGADAILYQLGGSD